MKGTGTTDDGRTDRFTFTNIVLDLMSNLKTILFTELEAESQPHEIRDRVESEEPKIESNIEANNLEGSV